MILKRVAFAVWNKVKNDCLPSFCKFRFPSVLQALIYEEYYPEDPEKPGPVRIKEVFDEYGPMELVLEAGNDADGAVGWCAISFVSSILIFIS